MTYSIVARDPDTGEMGVAVQTAIPFVGTLCPFAEAGVGAVASQASVRPEHGPNGLMLMRRGYTAQQALDAVLAGDERSSRRQVGMVDAKGNAASFTGADTIRYAGHQVGEQFAVQANMMATDTVPAAMAEAFTTTTGALAYRMLAALEAAQAQGGDFRGMQSAALKIVGGELAADPSEALRYDLRVDDSEKPLKDLRRLVDQRMAWLLIEESYTALGADQPELALEKYEQAIKLSPTNELWRFDFAVTVADHYGRIDLAKMILPKLFKENPMWIECLTRMTDAEPLQTEGLAAQLIAMGD